MMTLGKISFSVDLLSIIVTIIITALGSDSEPASSASSSVSGVLLALLGSSSNISLASRNTGLKYFFTKQNNIGGICNVVSLAGFLSLLPLWLYLAVMKTSVSFYAACVSHAAYNIISITLVLSVFDPLQHALLNVVKRVSIVLVFYLLVQKIPSPFNIISGLISMSGSKHHCVSW